MRASSALLNTGISFGDLPDRRSCWNERRDRGVSVFGQERDFADKTLARKDIPRILISC
jgi:hypothetical protein